MTDGTLLEELEGRLAYLKRVAEIREERAARAERAGDAVAAAAARVKKREAEADAEVVRAELVARRERAARVAPDPPVAAAPAGKPEPEKKPEKKGPSEPRVEPEDGSTIEVIGPLGEGGMGKVYRVRHLAWDLDLALKVPRAEVIKPGFLASLVAEAEAWAGLGLHPNIVCCHYVRRQAGVPWLFAEYVDGGSLSDWIRKRKLHAGDRPLARLLDVAIQTARGLAHAHEHGLIHQDVKPGNVMMTAGGVAKVTDFGLARVARKVTPPRQRHATLMVDYAGMTPAYCSPEQAAAARGQKVAITRRSDLWSWAVMVLEMFAGEVTWAHGTVAGAALEAYLEDPPRDLPAMPAAVAALLRRCFAEEPGQRPASMTTVAAELSALYGELFGAFPRPAPSVPEELAAVLTNRGASLLDLDRPDEARRAFDQAVRVEPHHLHATYDRGLVMWRGGEITDDELVRVMLEARQSHPDDWEAELMLGWIHVERGDHVGAQQALDAAARKAGDDPHAARRIERARATRTVAFAADGGGELHAAAGPAVIVEAGQTIVAAGREADASHSIRVWRVGDRTCRQIPTPHEVVGLAASEDARFAVTAGGVIALWDLASGARIQAFPARSAAAVAITRDGRRAAASDGVLIQVLDVAAGRLVATLRGHDQPVSALALSADGTRMLSAGADGMAWIWDVDDRHALFPLRHPAPVDRAAVTGDGRRGVTASWDETRAHYTLFVWDLRGGHRVCALPESRGALQGLALADDGSAVLTLRADGTLRRWEVARRRAVSTLLARGGGSRREAGVASLSASPSLDPALVVQRDAHLQIWAVGSEGPVAPVLVVRPADAAEAMERHATFGAAIHRVRAAFEHGDFPAAVARLAEARRTRGMERSPNALTWWAMLSQRCARGPARAAWSEGVWRDPGGAVRAVEISPDGSRLYSSGDHGLVRVFRPGAPEPVATLEHGGPVQSLAIDQRGSILATVEPGKLRAWRLRDHVCVKEIPVHGERTRLTLSADGRVLAAVGAECVELWEIATGRLLRWIELSGVRRVALTGDAERLLTAGGGPVRVWDVRRGEVEGTLADGDDAWDLVVTSDGARALGAGRGGRITLWDLTRRAVISRFDQGAAVTGLAMSFDGALAIVADVNGAVRVWDLERGRSVHDLGGHQNRVEDVALTPSGLLAVTGGQDGTVRTWRLQWELLPRPAVDFDEAAIPALDRFLERQRPLDADGITRAGVSEWSDDDEARLRRELGWAGLGYLRDPGIAAALRERRALRFAAAALGRSEPALDPPPLRIELDPVRLLVIADVGAGQGWPHPSPVPGSVEGLLEMIGPTVALPSFGVELALRSLADFDPPALVRRVPALAELLRTRASLAFIRPRLVPHAGALQRLLDRVRGDGRTSDEVAVALAAESSAVDDLARAALPPEHPAAEVVRAGLLAFVARVTARRHGWPALAAVDGAVSEIDDELAAALDAILADPTFRRIERTARSIAWLIERVGPRVGIDFLPCRLASDPAELHDRAVARNRADSYAAIVVDHDLAGPEDVLLLSSVAAVAHRLAAPVLVGAGPRLFGCASFAELARVDLPAARFTLVADAAYRAFAATEHAAFAALCAPGMRLRVAHEARAEVERFEYREARRGPEDEVTGSAAFALAADLAARAVRGEGVSCSPASLANLSLDVDLPVAHVVELAAASVLAIPPPRRGIEHELLAVVGAAPVDHAAAGVDAVAAPTCRRDPPQALGATLLLSRLGLRLRRFHQSIFGERGRVATEEEMSAHLAGVLARGVVPGWSARAALRLSGDVAHLELHLVPTAGPARVLTASLDLGPPAPLAVTPR